MTILKKTIALVLALAMIFQLTACGIKETAKNAANKVADGATTAKDYVVDGVLSAKDAVVKWYDGIDLNKFEDGWNSAIAYMGTAYSAAMSSEYVASVGVAINNLKVQMNSATGSARGIAQEAGYAAEKWAAGTFNIDSVVRSSSYKAEVVGSNDLGSVDVTTNYGENASLKYYQSANGSAQAQAESLIDAYRKYYSQATRNGAKEPMSLQEYMVSHGFVRDSQKDLLASIYEGQTRIIPTDQLSEATAYLEGRITKV